MGVEGPRILYNYFITLLVLSYMVFGSMGIIYNNCTLSLGCWSECDCSTLERGQIGLPNENANCTFTGFILHLESIFRENKS